MATFGGLSALIVNDSIRPVLTRALHWERLEGENEEARDRGAAQDVYEGIFSLRGTRAQLEPILYLFGVSARSSFVISLGPGEAIFGPEITATQATVVGYPVHARESFGRYFADDIRLRALNPVSAGTPSLGVLQLAAHRYTADTDYNIRKHFAYVPTTVNYADRRSDQGIFKAVFRQTDAEMINIRRYVTTIARGGVIPFPPINGITHPWGPRGPSSGGDCRIRFFGNERRVGLRWEFEMHLVREN